MSSTNNYNHMAYMQGISDGIRNPHYEVPVYYAGTDAEMHWRRGNKYAKGLVIGVKTKYVYPQ